jgi:cytochrome c-type biogenesis protein CcmH
VTVAAFLLLLAPAFAPTMHAQQTERAKALGAKLFCSCGCNQILTACNHVSCPASPVMLKELDARVARGDSDDLILQSFVQEYGLTVLAQPSAKGFNTLVWIMPIVAPILAFFLIWQVVRRWRRRAVLAPAGGPSLSPELLDRARRQAEKEIDE